MLSIFKEQFELVMHIEVTWSDFYEARNNNMFFPIPTSIESVFFRAHEYQNNLKLVCITLKQTKLIENFY